MNVIDKEYKASDLGTLPLEDIDYIEIYAGNARQSAFYYHKLFGFKITAYSGLETGNRAFCSYVLEQNAIRLVITGTYSSDNHIADYLKKHGDGVRDIAFRVKNLDEAYATLVKNGVQVIREPYEEKDANGVVKKAVIKTFGDTIHTFVERSEYTGVFLPNYEEYKGGNEDAGLHKADLQRVDHIAINVENADQWYKYYESVFGFTLIREFKKEEISSSNSALMTKALQDETERVKFVIVEPAKGDKKSQIEEYLEYNNGEGVNHIAFLSDDIVDAVSSMKKNGKEFLYTPSTYYEMLPQRVGEIDESLSILEELCILVDKDDEGYLLQIFGQPVQDRPTMYFEIIQRKGAKGFGNGNIRALFEAVEREQAKRGNLI